jgi:hypothetical protein
MDTDKRGFLTAKYIKDAKNFKKEQDDETSIRRVSAENMFSSALSGRVVFFVCAPGMLSPANFHQPSGLKQNGQSEQEERGGAMNLKFQI